jgi:hypothetical protein
VAKPSAIDVCASNGVTFELRDLGGRCEWVFPDGSRTGIGGDWRDQARRAMMFRPSRLAAEWKRVESTMLQPIALTTLRPAPVDSGSSGLA